MLKKMNIDRIKVNASIKVLSRIEDIVPVDTIDVDNMRDIAKRLIADLEYEMNDECDRIYLEEDQRKLFMDVMKHMNRATVTALELKPEEHTALIRCYMQLSHTRKEYASLMENIKKENKLFAATVTCQKEWFLETVKEGPHPEILAGLKKKLGPVKKDMTLYFFMEQAHDFFYAHKQQQDYLALYDFVVSRQKRIEALKSREKFMKACHCLKNQQCRRAALT